VVAALGSRQQRSEVLALETKIYLAGHYRKELKMELNYRYFPDRRGSLTAYSIMRRVAPCCYSPLFNPLGDGKKIGKASGTVMKPLRAKPNKRRGLAEVEVPV